MDTKEALDFLEKKITEMKAENAMLRQKNAALKEAVKNGNGGKDNAVHS